MSTAAESSESGISMLRPCKEALRESGGATTPAHAASASPPRLSFCSRGTLDLSGGLLDLSSDETARAVETLGAELRVLKLSDNGLTTLPPFMRLHGGSIVGMDLGCNRIAHLAHAAELRSLCALTLHANALSSLPAGVELLPSLQRLDLTENQLESLPPAIATMRSRLLELALRCNRFSAIPPPVFALEKLQLLDLGCNRLGCIPDEIGRLSELRELTLDDNEIREMPLSLGKLRQLDWLNLANNHLTTLPVAMDWSRLGRNALWLQGNPLEAPCYSACERGAHAMCRFHISLARQGAAVSRAAKLVLVGAGMAGKSSLLRGLQTRSPTLADADERTVALELSSLVLGENERSVHVSCWDFGGQEGYAPAQQPYLASSALYLLVVPVHRANDAHEGEVLGRWLDVLQARAPGAVVQPVLSQVDRVIPGVPALLTEREQATSVWKRARIDAALSKMCRPEALETAAADATAWVRARLRQQEQRHRSRGHSRQPQLSLHDDEVPCVTSIPGGCMSIVALQKRLEQLVLCEPPLLPTVGQLIPRSWLVPMALVRSLRDGRDPLQQAALTLALTPQQAAVCAARAANGARTAAPEHGCARELSEHDRSTSAVDEAQIALAGISQSAVCDSGALSTHASARTEAAMPVEAEATRSVERVPIAAKSLSLDWSAGKGGRLEAVTPPERGSRRGSEGSASGSARATRVAAVPVRRPHEVSRLRRRRPYVAVDELRRLHAHLISALPVAEGAADPTALDDALQLMVAHGEIFCASGLAYLEPSFVTDLVRPLVDERWAEVAAAPDPRRGARAHLKSYVCDGRSAGASEPGTLVEAAVALAVEGELREELLPFLWRGVDVGDKTDSMLQMLCEGGLLFTVCHSRPRRWVMPIRLPLEQPAAVHSAWAEGAPREGEWQLRAGYAVWGSIPVGAVERAVAAVHDVGQYRQYWRRGALVVCSVGADLLQLMLRARATGDGEEALTVEVRGTSLDRLRLLLARVCNKLDVIFSDFPGVMYDAQYACPHCLRAGRGEAAQQWALRGLADSVYCPKCHEHVKVSVGERELLIFVCSPTASPLAHGLHEAHEVASTCAGAVEIRNGGSAQELRMQLQAAPTRRFLFTGHADAPSPVCCDGEQALSRSLGFTKPGGGVDMVDPAVVAGVLGIASVAHGGRLELVVLNGCCSEPMGRAVYEAGVPTVLCWASRVEDRAARLFAKAFFEMAAAAHDYRTCFEGAKAAVQLVTRPGESGGVCGSVPRYELRVPGTASAWRCTPTPIAAGVPVLITSD